MTRNELLNHVDALIKVMRKYDPGDSRIAMFAGAGAREPADAERLVHYWMQFFGLAPGMTFRQAPCSSRCECGEDYFVSNFRGVDGYGYARQCHKCPAQWVEIYEPRPMPLACEHPRPSVDLGCQVCRDCGVPWKQRRIIDEDVEQLVPDRFEGWLAAAA